MNAGPTFELLVLFAAASAVYAAVWMTYSRLPRPGRAAVWVLGTLSVLFWLAIDAGYAAAPGPLSAWTIQMRSAWAIDWTAPLTAAWCATAQMRINRKRPPRGPVARHNGLVLAWLIFLPTFIAGAMAPIPPRWANQWQGDVCIQSDGNTCVAAVAATLLRRYGKPVSEEEAAKAVNVSRKGTTLWDLARGLRSYGLRTRAVYIGHDLDRGRLPMVAAVRLENERGIPHAILIESLTPDTVTIVDPLGGRFTWPRPKLFANYYFLGLGLEVSGPEE